MKEKVRAKKRGQNKYNATKVSSAGRSFASKLEFAVFEHLLLLEKSGDIKFEKQQVSVHLTAARIRYIPDFLIYDLKNNENIWVEAKGFETDVWRLKRKLWTVYGPGPLWVYGGSYRDGVYLHEEIIPKPPKLDQPELPLGPQKSPADHSE